MKPTAFLDLLMSMEDYFDGTPCLNRKRYILQRTKKDQLACEGVASKTNFMGPTSHQHMHGTKWSSRWKNIFFLLITSRTCAQNSSLSKVLEPLKNIHRSINWLSGIKWEKWSSTCCTLQNKASKGASTREGSHVYMDSRWYVSTCP